MKIDEHPPRAPVDLGGNCRGDHDRQRSDLDLAGEPPDASRYAMLLARTSPTKPSRASQIVGFVGLLMAVVGGTRFERHVRNWAFLIVVRPIYEISCAIVKTD